MSVGRLITELQANYRRELERSESLQKEVDELRDMAMVSVTSNHRQPAYHL